MKRVAFLLISIVIFGCVQMDRTVKTGFEGSVIPSCKLLLIDSSRQMSTDEISFSGPVVFLYFSPYCPFCKGQTEDIVANIKSMNDIHFYLLSNFPLSDIKHYCEKLNLGRYEGIVVAQDYNSYFGNYYKIPGVPYMAIYKNKRLQRVLIGRVEIATIKNVARE